MVVSLQVPGTKANVIVPGIFTFYFCSRACERA